MIRPAAIALAAALTTPALAQPALNAALVDIVREWTAATGLPEPVIDFGESCLMPLLVALPAETKQIVVEAGDLDEGVEAAELYELVQECAETMLVGEQIWRWVEATDGSPARAICIMEATRPLPTEAKLTLFEAFDFEEGLSALRTEEPDLAASLDQAIAACP